MAAEMDDRIRTQTSGQKSLRDALRYLMAWTAQNRRAFRTDELPEIFRQATGVDTTSILEILDAASASHSRKFRHRCTDRERGGTFFGNSPISLCSTEVRMADSNRTQLSKNIPISSARKPSPISARS